MSTSPNFLSLYKTGLVPNCSTLYLLEPGERYSVMKDGQLHHQGYEHTLAYCVEIRVRDSGRNIMVLKCQEQEMCKRDNWEYHIIFTNLGMVSLFSLAMTFIVYLSVPDLFNLHGKIVVSNVSSIFLVTSYIIVVYNVSATTSFFCIILGYFGYFVSILMFGWMTVFCLDLCCTICNAKSSYEVSRFILFSIFAWGLAASLTVFVICLDVLLPDGSDMKPNVGISSCFIEDV